MSVRPDVMRPSPSSDGARSPVGILGWSLGMIESLRRAGREFCVVGPPDCEQYARANGVPFLAWELGELSASSAHRLAGELEARGVSYTVPVFEPLVEWHGAVDAVLRGRPERAEWVRLFRDKAMMNRRAQLRDIPVGVFRVANTRAAARAFLEHVNGALLAHEPVKPIHIKAFDEAGCKGHFEIANDDDLARVPDDAFPCLVESDLEGQEIACEIWVHDREIVFMNISEYIHLGHSVMTPPSPALEARREELREVNQRLIEAFEIEQGFIHPEWFLRDDGAIHFGEVAYRIPGGNAFELIERAYGFDPYLALTEVMDPDADREAVRALFPDETAARGHAAVLLAYPPTDAARVIDEVDIPVALAEDRAVEGHDLMVPFHREVAPRDTFLNGTHWGNIWMFSDDPARLRRLCLKYEDYAFHR